MKNIYTSGKYLKNNPDWHAHDAPWKACNIAKVILKNNLAHEKIDDVGCGSGQILKELERMLPKAKKFRGFDISPKSISMAQDNSSNKLSFYIDHYENQPDQVCDILLVIDVLEHIKKYKKFLRDIKSKSQYKIFHIPIDRSLKNIILKKNFSRLQKDVGHVDFFSVNQIFEILKQSGYEILDWQITHFPQKNKLEKIRMFCAKSNSRICAQIAGDCSILIVAK